MAEDALIRRENFKRLMEARGWAVRELPKTLGWGRYSFWNDLLADDRPKSFGEKLARKIEEKAHLPRGWLDSIEAKAPSQAPRLPPADFADRHEVSESDWSDLQAAKTVLTPKQWADIRERAEQAERVFAQKYAAIAGRDASHPTDENLGGMSNFAEFDEAPVVKKEGKR